MSEELKSCPNCGGRGNLIFGPNDSRIHCFPCGIRTKLSVWDSLPRREEFHAELVKLVDYSSPEEGGYSDIGDLVKALHFQLLDLASKYAPSQEADHATDSTNTD